MEKKRMNERISKATNCSSEKMDAVRRESSRDKTNKKKEKKRKKDKWNL